MIVDNPYRELRFGGQDQGVAAFKQSDRAIHVTTFTKTLGPGWRVGWLVLPDPSPPTPPATRPPDRGLPADHCGVRRGRGSAAGMGGLRGDGSGDRAQQRQQRPAEAQAAGRTRDSLPARRSSASLLPRGSPEPVGALLWGGARANSGSSASASTPL
ncbi:hypothetical protein [Streptomyces sp. NPDC001833]|uniref:hypothetical protein n=1 Tax=Streptomyces sp. NPDC001833 TaxID=3154658 RepID=UPI00332086B3